MCTRRTGGARYLPDLTRDSSDSRFARELLRVVLHSASVDAADLDNALRAGLLFAAPSAVRLRDASHGGDRVALASGQAHPAQAQAA